MKYERILFPVDFSERCRAVAPFVSAVAKRDGAAVTLAHFIEIPALWYAAAEGPSITEVNLSHWIEEAEHNLTFLKEEFFPGAQTNILVEEGDAGTRIVELAHSSKTSLIMLPTRGHGRFRAALPGSVTAKVLHDALCPVWTEAHVETPPDPSATEWRNVICAVDTTPDAQQIIRYAVELACSYHARIHLVHAVPAALGTRPEKYFDHEFEAYVKESACAAIEAMQREAGASFPLSIEAGKPAAVVAAIAEDDKADLVLIGRGALPHFGGRLRTNVFAIVRDSPCPVLSV